jgi:hypothetical protein
MAGTTVYVVIGRDSRGEREVEVLDAKPKWCWPELGQRVYAASVNGGDSQEVAYCGPERKKHDLVGRRVRLIHCTDEHTMLTPGDEGTVSFVDSLGTLHVDWFDGSRLGLVADEDEWLVLP